MNSISITLLFAVAENGIIGRDGDMPWRLSTDLKRFKANTIGRPVIMGRKTWQSLGQPLPGRPNIVVTRDPDFVAEGAHSVGTIDAAIERADSLAREIGAQEICVIGGGEIYRQVWQQADTLKITRIFGEIDGDTHFDPKIDLNHWECSEKLEFPAGEKDTHPTSYEVWRRKG